MSALNKTRRNNNNKRDALSILSNGSKSNISIKEVIILQNKLEMTTTDINNLLQNIISEVEKPSAFNIFDISGIKVNENITHFLNDIDKKIKTKISDKEYYNSLLNTISRINAKFLNLLSINELTYENINTILNKIQISNILSDDLEDKINKLSISNDKLVINNQYNAINNKHTIKGDVQIPRTLLLLAILATACSASMSDIDPKSGTKLIKRGGTYYNHPPPPAVKILRASRRLIPLLVRFPQLLCLLFIFIIWNTLFNISTRNEPILGIVENIPSRDEGEIVEGEIVEESVILPAVPIMNAELLAPPVSVSPLSQQDPRPQRRWPKLPKLPKLRLKLPSWRPWTRRNQPAPQGGSRKKRRN